MLRILIQVNGRQPANGIAGPILAQRLNSLKVLIEPDLQQMQDLSGHDPSIEPPINRYKSLTKVLSDHKIERYHGEPTYEIVKYRYIVYNGGVFYTLKALELSITGPEV